MPLAASPLTGLPVYFEEPEMAERGFDCPGKNGWGDASAPKIEKIMPKLKTHSGAAKRFSKTGTGKIKRRHTKTRHILTSKAPKTKRKLGKSEIVSAGDHAKVARMIPYA